MKTKKKIKRIKPCPKTVSGRHYWEEINMIGYTIYEEVGLKKCLLCDLVDDTNL